MPRRSDTVKSYRSLALLVAAAAALAASCGSDAPLAEIEARVFADWNANGVKDVGESGLAKIGVELGGVAQAETDASGRADFEVAGGTYRARLTRLPPEWKPTGAAEVSVHAAEGGRAEVSFGIRPDVPASRLPYKLVLTGDSITTGFMQLPPPSIDYVVDGFDAPLGTRLAQHWGRAGVANRSIPGTKGSCGPSMLQSRLTGDVGLLTCHCKRPDQFLGQPEDPESQDAEPFGPGAYLLILYGSNDINDPGNCLQGPGCARVLRGCDTLAHLEQMVLRTRGAGMIPVLGTVLPGHKQHQCTPNWNERFNANVEALNADIRRLATETGTILADYWKAFRSPKSPPIEALISDIEVWTLPDGKRRCGPGLHPTKAGYELMAEVAYLALTGQPSPYEDTPTPQTKTLDEATADYLRFMQETGFQPEPLPLPLPR
jgi:lysophospholipase L1-like esterase